MPGEYTEFDKGSRFFFRNVNLHASKQYAAHSEAMPFSRGVQGHAPPRKSVKIVQFDISWSILIKYFF